MRQSSNLCIETQPCLALFLRKFELAFFVFANIRNLDLVTERRKNFVFSLVDDSLQLFDLSLNSVVGTLGLSR